MKKLLLVLMLLSTINAENVKDLSYACNHGKFFQCIQLNKTLKPETIKDYIKHCNGGIAYMCYQVGINYKFGKGTEQNDVKSSKYFAKSCKGGFVGSCYMLALNYANGIGVKQNSVEASKFFAKACKKGHPESCFSLGVMYTGGQGIKRNYSKSVSLYKKACSAGNDSGCYNLAIAYLNGTGVKKDNKTAFVWMKRIAKNGNANAQRFVGNMYLDGIGVSKDYIKAYAWINLSVSNGLQDAMVDLLKLEDKMTPQKIKIAKKFDPIGKLKVSKPKKNSVIKPKSKEPIIYTGTGFFVDLNTVLTNNHVANKECKKLELVRKGYKSRVTLIANDVNNDLALLKADKSNNSFLKFRTGKGIRLGNEILVLGYPLGDLLGSSLKVTTGNISSLTGLSDDTTRLQITAPVQPGNSGGPLLDSNGDIVGVVYAKLAKRFSAENVNLAIKSNVAQMFLDINRVNYKTRAIDTPKNLADIVDEAMNSVVQVVCTQ